MDEANDVPLVDLHVVGADACPAAPSLSLSLPATQATWTPGQTISNRAHKLALRWQDFNEKVAKLTSSSYKSLLNPRHEASPLGYCLLLF